MSGLSEKVESQAQGERKMGEAFHLIVFELSVGCFAGLVRDIKWTKGAAYPGKVGSYRKIIRDAYVISYLGDKAHGTSFILYESINAPLFT